LITHNTHKRQAPLTPAGFKPATPASERLETLALDLTAKKYMTKSFSTDTTGKFHPREFMQATDFFKGKC
jgi:hypothetical protein